MGVKNGKKDSAFIDDPQRCEVCGTTLTLYPKDFAPCPHCRKTVCRQCWGAVWSAKSFAAESCAHIAENDGRTLASAGVGENRGQWDWDWPRILFAVGLAALAIGILVVLFNLFVV